MEITLAIIISIISVVIAVSSFVLNRKDKSNEKVEKFSYDRGRLDEALESIDKRLEKIEKKLDSYDNEIKSIVNEAMKNHIQIYHNKGGKNGN